jgi:hypothetical protein
MPVTDLSDWINEHSGKGFTWFVKRLSGNDTLANKSHQAGPYIPKSVAFALFPDLKSASTKNPDVRLDLYIDSHSDHRNVRVVWYNSKTLDKSSNGRDEIRITQLGGAASALLDPENTGALVVFSFLVNPTGSTLECHAWVCEHDIQAELIEEIVGPTEPGHWVLWSGDQERVPSLFSWESKPRADCWLSSPEIEAEWGLRFPSAADIVGKSIQFHPFNRAGADQRLVARRKCEFEIFRSIEEAIELPAIKLGSPTIDAFIGRAQTILQRRKSRSGKSLELQLKAIFLEEGLVEGKHFSYQPRSEGKSRPDFLFPSEAHYKDSRHPAHRLRMLAVKTTLKDRWRQILREARRIDQKHLLTLQEGISESQFHEIASSGVTLVVPASVAKSYSRTVRPNLQTLESFIADMRIL